MRTSALFGAKTSELTKFMVCPHGQGGLSQSRHFSDKGEGVNFLAILCGRLLWTVPNDKKNRKLKTQALKYQEKKTSFYNTIYIHSTKFEIR